MQLQTSEFFRLCVPALPQNFECEANLILIKLFLKGVKKKAKNIEESFQVECGRKSPGLKAMVVGFCICLAITELAGKLTSSS